MGFDGRGLTRRRIIFPAVAPANGGGGVNSFTANGGLINAGTATDPVAQLKNFVNLSNGILPNWDTAGVNLEDSPLFTDGTKMGVNTTSPEIRFHIVVSGTAGTPAILNEGVGVQNNSMSTDNVSLSLISGNAALASVLFGDAESTTVGRITYDHSGNEMQFFTSGFERMVILSSGDVGIGIEGPAVRFHVLKATLPRLRCSHTTATSEAIIEAFSNSGNQTSLRQFGSTAVPFSGTAGWSAANASTFYGTGVSTNIVNTNNSGFIAWHLGPGINTSERMRIAVTGGRLSLGLTSTTSKFHIFEDTAGDDIQTWETQAVETTDDPIQTWAQDDVTTTNATTTAIFTIPIATNDTVRMFIQIVARRTGGTAGSVGDSASFKLEALFKDIAGTVTQVSTTTKLSKKDVAMYDANLTISGTNVLVEIEGVADTNISWHALIETAKINS